jgi:hypothetical protein
MVQAGVNKKWDPIFKKPEQKGMGVWIYQYNTCLVIAKPWVQTPVPPKKKVNKLGIQGMYLNIIKDLYSKPTDNIVLNGMELRAF